MRTLTLVACAIAMLSLDGCYFTRSRRSMNDEAYARWITDSYPNHRFDASIAVVVPRSAVVGSQIELTVPPAPAGDDPLYLCYCTPEFDITSMDEYATRDFIHVVRASDHRQLHISTHGAGSGDRSHRIVRRLHYLYTVPLDVVTCPLQLLFFLVMPAC